MHPFDLDLCNSVASVEFRPRPTRPGPLAEPALISSREPRWRHRAAARELQARGSHHPRITGAAALLITGFAALERASVCPGAEAYIMPALQPGR